MPKASIVTKQSNSNKKAFSLIEVLITLIIITLGVVAIVGAFSSGMAASAAVADIDLALNIAQAKMEEIKNTAFASLADSASAPDSQFSRFSTSVNVAEGANPKQVDVTVIWNTKGGQETITLTTLIADYSTQ